MLMYSSDPISVGAVLYFPVFCTHLCLCGYFFHMAELWFVNLIPRCTMTDKTPFNDARTDKRLNPQFADWIAPVKMSSKEACCTACRTVINLSNMGRSALVSHAKGSKHLMKMNAREHPLQTNILGFVNKNTSRNVATVTTTSSNIQISPVSNPDMPVTAVSTMAVPQSSSTPQHNGAI